MQVSGPVTTESRKSTAAGNVMAIKTVMMAQMSPTQNVSLMEKERERKVFIFFLASPKPERNRKKRARLRERWMMSYLICGERIKLMKGKHPRKI